MKECKAYLRFVHTIVQEIADGKLAYDEKFYSEQELSDKFHMSIPTLREALRVLEFMGIITVKPHRGIHIHHPEDSGGYPVMRYILDFESPSQQELQELHTALTQVPTGNRPAAKLIETVDFLLSAEGHTIKGQV